MTFEEWYGSLLPFERKCLTREEAFQAGATSRDAEVAKLINAVADHVTARIELRAHINKLREAATPFTSPDVVDETSGTIPLMDALEKALSSTPEQSLAEYQNKVIEDCSREGWVAADTACEDRVKAFILAMKKQPT